MCTEDSQLTPRHRADKIDGINDFVASAMGTGTAHASGQADAGAAASSTGIDAAVDDADPVTEKRSRKRAKVPSATPSYQTKE